MKKQTTKIERLIAALRKGKLSVRQITTRFNVPNVSAIIYDIRRKGVNVHTTRTATGMTAYTLAA